MNVYFCYTGKKYVQRKGGDVLNGIKATILTIFIFCIVILAGFYVLQVAPDLNRLNTVVVSINDMLSLNKNVYAQASTRDSSQLMARAINGEARGESFIGQVAVGAVILNRSNHPSFPKTIPGVIYQPGAFTAVSDGQINVPIDSSSTVVKAARDALNGWDPTGGSIYYFNPSTATSGWIWSRQQVTQIGKHIFAK